MLTHAIYTTNQPSSRGEMIVFPQHLARGQTKQNMHRYFPRPFFFDLQVSSLSYSLTENISDTIYLVSLEEDWFSLGFLPDL